jgi:two-component system chemotaxis response regulator CheY
MVDKTAKPRPSATKAAPRRLSSPSITGLFDPYMQDRGGAWRTSTATPPAFTCRWISEGADEDIAALPQHLGTQGRWHAVWLALSPQDMAHWRSPQRQPIGTTLLQALADLVHQLVIYVPQHGALLALIQCRDPGQIVAVAKDMGRLLDNGMAVPFIVQDTAETGPFAERCAQYAKPITPLVTAEAPALMLDERTRFRLTAHQLAMRAQRTQAHILLIEDDPSTVMLLGALIDKRWSCASAANAADAADTYRRVVPNVVFLDIGLPDMNGLELLSRLLAGDPEAYIVMLTANATGANVQAALKAGAKGFLAKPFTRERIQGALNKALAPLA